MRTSSSASGARTNTGGGAERGDAGPRWRRREGDGGTGQICNQVVAHPDDRGIGRGVTGEAEEHGEAPTPPKGHDQGLLGPAEPLRQVQHDVPGGVDRRVAGLDGGSGEGEHVGGVDQRPAPGPERPVQDHQLGAVGRPGGQPVELTVVGVVELGEGRLEAALGRGVADEGLEAARHVVERGTQGGAPQQAGEGAPAVAGELGAGQLLGQL